MTVEFAQPRLLFAAILALPALLFYLARLARFRVALAPLVEGGDRARGMGVKRRAAPIVRILACRAVCLALAWVFLSVAASGPRWGTKLVAQRQEGSSVAFVFDISRSMNLADVTPTRLEYAARYASLLADRLERSPCAVVLAKGDAVIALPLTSDHRALRDLLASLSPTLLTSPGSNPGKGILAALRAFPEGSARSRAVILFTDGDETSSSLEDAARACGKAGATLVIVGTGTAGGASVRVYPGSDKPETRQSRLREDLLAKAAREAGGSSLYVNGSETSSAIRVLDAILDPTVTGSRLVYSNESVPRYPEFAFAALALVCAGVLIGGLSWKRK